MGKNFNREQTTVCGLLFLSFLAGIVAVYFGRFRGIPIGRSAIFTAITLLPITFLYLRKFFEVLNAVLFASLGGLTVGAGVSFLGLWFIYDNPARMWHGPKWLFVGSMFIIAFISSLKKLKPTLTQQEFTEAELQEMSDIERLRIAERSLSNEEVFAPMQHGNIRLLAISFISLGLIIAVYSVFKSESNLERMVIIGVLVVIGPIIGWLILWVNRQNSEFDALLTDINEHRTHALISVREKISELEPSAGGDLPPPTETN